MKKIGKLILFSLLTIGFAACKNPTAEPTPPAPPVPPAPVLESIEITQKPAKTIYDIGEEINLNGMVVTATYSDNTTKNVTGDCTVTGFDSSKEAVSKTITVTYEEKTAEFKIEIKDYNLKSITIINKPTKLMYTIDDDFDSTGLKVEAKYSDNTTKDITENIEVVGFDKTAEENKTITVKYGNKTDTFEVNVYECILEIDFYNVYNGHSSEIFSNKFTGELDSSKYIETKYLGIVELTESFDGYYCKENGEKWILIEMMFFESFNEYLISNFNYNDLKNKIKNNRVVKVPAIKV